MSTDIYPQFCIFSILATFVGQNILTSKMLETTILSKYCNKLHILYFKINK